MTFHNVRLPDNVEKGAIGGALFNTSKIPLVSGRNRKNINWSQRLGDWDISYGILELADLEIVNDFFHAREGSAHTFRFKVWGDFTISRQAIGLTDTSNTDFQIFKRYSSGGVDYDNTITKIVTGTELVWVDDVAITEGAGTSQYTLDDTTGLIVLGATLAGQSGTVVEVECEFDRHVSFTDDKLDISMELFDAGELPGISIEEQRV